MIVIPFFVCLCQVLMLNAGTVMWGGCQVLNKLRFKIYTTVPIKLDSIFLIHKISDYFFAWLQFVFSKAKKEKFKLKFVVNFLPPYRNFFQFHLSICFPDDTVKFSLLISFPQTLQRDQKILFFITFNGSAALMKDFFYGSFFLFLFLSLASLAFFGFLVLYIF